MNLATSCRFVKTNVFNNTKATPFSLTSLPNKIVNPTSQLSSSKATSRLFCQLQQQSEYHTLRPSKVRTAVTGATTRPRTFCAVSPFGGSFNFASRLAGSTRAGPAGLQHFSSGLGILTVRKINEQAQEQEPHLVYCEQKQDAARTNSSQQKRHFFSGLFSKKEEKENKTAEVNNKDVFSLENERASSLVAKMTEHGYDYDLFVVGGGSGGLAAAKKAGEMGKKTAVADFVEPSPAGTSWGLGGTCLNVGCIPKKLCHFAAQAPEFQQDFAALGWEFHAMHSWDAMITNIDNYIKGSNWGNKTDLRTKDVKYYNKHATFVDAHTLQLRDKKGNLEQVTADKIMVAVGGRPNMGGYPGVEECCISSDDIFWRSKPPGKTLVVGASYIALECAGFLASLGFDTTVMVRSILLRGFDRDMADRIGSYMEDHGVKFARGMIPSKFEKTEDGRTRVFVNDKEFGDYDTVLMAIGRQGLAAKLNLEAAGVKYDPKNGKIFVDDADTTNVPNITAIGDIAHGRLELTPVAIQSGKFLVNRLFGGSSKLMDYTNVATTVFTPLEFGTVGLSEDDALEKYGKSGIEVYHGYQHPLEWRCNHDRSKTACYMKMVCDVSNDKVLGLHVLGPNAGEMIQGFAVAIKCGVTRDIINETVGIHPTVVEKVCDLTEIKKEGVALDGPANC
ncbi:unnamed protein product [Amoebophrya sp. A120]|nr:unnamed protein product [Amoebophrya sp. A120]|eukprot:GSA120T00021828001.1